MIRSSLFSLLCLLVLGFSVSSCDGSEVDLTNVDIDPPIIEVEAGTFNYTVNGRASMDTGISFVCRTDSLVPGSFNHHYNITNTDISGVSDTNLIVPIAQGDVLISGYTDDPTNIEGVYLSMMVETAVGILELASCFDCPITMTEDGTTLTGTFSGTLLTSNPDSVFFITDGTFEVPLVELDCN